MLPDSRMRSTAYDRIRFLRLSSEMFPFASHAKYGYSLEYAAAELKEAGDLAKSYGHRLTMHPGQVNVPLYASPARQKLITVHSNWFTERSGCDGFIPRTGIPMRDHGPHGS
jgi:hypothetical protein